MRDADKIYIAGIGPGGEDYILPAAMRAISDSDVLIGGERSLEGFRQLGKEEVAIGGDLDAVCRYIFHNRGKKRITVLASGDPGIFSIAKFLKGRLGGGCIEVIPGISSLQYLCARLGIEWNDVYMLSVHGRAADGLIDAVRNNPKVILFTGGSSTPDSICRRLAGNGLVSCRIAVGENLSYSNERITEGAPEDMLDMSFEPLSIMYIESGGEGGGRTEPGQTECKEDSFAAGGWNYATYGIPDGMLKRGETPMTKEEVRCIALSKLRIRETDTVYDIGAGTGSVSVECGLICKSGRVYSIEKDASALQLIKDNALRFGLRNIHVVHGEAPEALKALPPPDRVFIGGTSGKLEEILQALSDIKRSIRVVVSAVTIESVYEAVKGFEKRGFIDIGIACVSVSRGGTAGDKHIMRALNPVHIISAQKPQNKGCVKEVSYEGQAVRSGGGPGRSRVHYN